MMKLKIGCTVCFIVLFLQVEMVQAQYYYKDIVAPKQSATERLLLQEQKIRTIKVHSFEGDRTESPGFFCEKQMSKDYRRIATYTKTTIQGKSLLTAYFNAEGQLIKSVDTSEIAASTTTYQYNEQGNLVLISISSHSSDDDFTTTLTETRSYTYDKRNRPIQMKRIKNGRDSVLIDFVQDEKGNITDEILPGKNGVHYYYYYDDKNRLTDIVRFNVVQNKLLPDFVFEYNSQHLVTKMVTVEEGAINDYYTWEYIYNDEGLKIIEKCFSKERILMGYVEYEYE
jgi:YD repeat-containing protein